MSEHLTTKDIGSPTDGQSGWFATYCKICGEYVTKFDHTAEESAEYGRNHLRDVHGIVELVS